MNKKLSAPAVSLLAPEPGPPAGTFRWNVGLAVRSAKEAVREAELNLADARATLARAERVAAHHRRLLVGKRGAPSDGVDSVQQVKRVVIKKQDDTRS